MIGGGRTVFRIVIAGDKPSLRVVPELFAHHALAALQFGGQRFRRLAIRNARLHIFPQHGGLRNFDLHIRRHLFEIYHTFQSLMERQIGIEIHVRERDRIPESVADSDADALFTRIEMADKISVADHAQFRRIQMGQMELHRAARHGQNLRQ